jgi:hypothetical protein
VSVRDGAVRLIFAGWLPQDGLFGRSASAGLGNERGFKGVNPIAVHSRNADHSTRSRLLVFLVRLLFVSWWKKPLWPRAVLSQGRSFLDPGDSCRCVGGVNVEHAQRSEHERR